MGRNKHTDNDKSYEQALSSLLVEAPALFKMPLYFEMASRSEIALLRSVLTDDMKGWLKGLTQLEADVLLLKSDGYEEPQMSAILGISEKGVEHALERARSKASNNIRSPASDKPDAVNWEFVLNTLNHRQAERERVSAKKRPAPKNKSKQSAFT